MSRASEEVAGYGDVLVWPPRRAAWSSWSLCPFPPPKRSAGYPAIGLEATGRSRKTEASPISIGVKERRRLKAEPTTVVVSRKLSVRVGGSRVACGKQAAGTS